MIEFIPALVCFALISGMLFIVGRKCIIEKKDNDSDSKNVGKDSGV
jgi:hypothetical protein